MLRPSIVLTLLLCAALAACGSVGGTPTPLPTVVLETGGDSPQRQGGATASGVVVPAQAAELGFALTGIVQTVHVAVGDRVEAGQVLVELENAGLEIALGQAQRNQRELTSPAAISAAEQAVVAWQSVDDAEEGERPGLSGLPITRSITSEGPDRAGQRGTGRVPPMTSGMLEARRS
jgi:multidrug efflux pump subunit AcrA (membrane-fusion protein)